MIHANTLGDVLLFRQFVNQAVPVFTVLFGLNSSWWWRRRPLPGGLREWYRNRVDRIMVPVWAVLPCWWAMVLWFRPSGVTLSWWLPLVQAAGYLLYVGTGWFVTLVLQLVVLQPALEALARRAGIGIVVALGVVATAVTTRFALDFVRHFGSFNLWIFPPRMLAFVVFGMLLARSWTRLG